MKKVAILVAFMCAFIAPTFAQNDAVAAPLTNEKVVGKSDRRANLKQASKELNLSAEQKTKMKEIGQSFKGKMMAIKSDAALSKDQRKIQVGEVAKGHEAEIKAVLSPEQFTKWQEMKSIRRDKMKQYHGKKGAAKSDEDGQ